MSDPLEGLRGLEPLYKYKCPRCDDSIQVRSANAVVGHRCPRVTKSRNWVDWERVDK